MINRVERLLYLSFTYFKGGVSEVTLNMNMLHFETIGAIGNTTQHT